MSVSRYHPPAKPTEQDVHDVAYHLWLEAGRQAGRERESWTRACELLSAGSVLSSLFERRAAAVLG